MDFGDTVVVEEEGKKLSDMDLEIVEGVEAFLSEFSTKCPIIILSNTIHSREADIQSLLEQLNFSQYFHRVITSLDMGVAKPDPKLYKIALDALNLNPEEVVMIGDRLDTDIKGAVDSGLSSIYLHWRDRHDEKSKNLNIVPTVEVKNYNELSEFLRTQI